MSKRESGPFDFDFAKLGINPLVAVQPWLKAQAGMMSALKGAADHWYERRSADLAAAQTIAGRLAACQGPDTLIEAHSACVKALTDRFMADMAGLREDLAAVGAAATAGLNDASAKGTSKAA